MGGRPWEDTISAAASSSLASLPRARMAPFLLAITCPCGTHASQLHDFAGDVSASAVLCLLASGQGVCRLDREGGLSSRFMHTLHVHKHPPKSMQ